MGRKEKAGRKDEVGGRRRRQEGLEVEEASERTGKKEERKRTTERVRRGWECKTWIGRERN